VPKSLDDSVNQRKTALLDYIQWQWSEKLQQFAEIQLATSSMKIISDQTNMDKWGVYPLERQKLFALVPSIQGDPLCQASCHPS